MKARRCGTTGDAKAGTMASSKGRDRAAPKPRRSVRRERTRRWGTRRGGRVRTRASAPLSSLNLFSGIRFTNNCFDELGEGLVPGNGWQRRFAAQRVGHQLRGQATRESVLIFEQELLQGVGAVARVDRQIAVVRA